jgi:IclR family pca regulon transcriptional regulator
VLDGDEIVYVLRVPAHKIMSINLGVGSRLPAYCTSMGRVLLAGLPSATLKQRLAAMSLTPLTPHTIVDPKHLQEAVEQVRVQGWCRVSEELEQGLVSLAAPIVDRNGRVVAAINISGQVNNPSPASLLENSLPKLLAAAAKINVLVRAQP